MATTAVRAGAYVTPRLPPRWGLGLLIGLAAVLALLLIAVLATPALVDRWVVPTLNRHVQDYRLEIGDAQLALLRGAVVLRDLAVIQEAHPDPPVATVPRVVAGLDWRGLFAGELGLAARVETPHLGLAPHHVTAELGDDTLLLDKGWIEGFRALSPLPINRVHVANAAVSFVARPGAAPLRVSDTTVDADGLAHSGEPGTFPSPLRITSTVFGRGRVRLEGGANVTNPARPTIDTELVMHDVPIDALAPLAAPFGVRIGGGTAAGEGHVTFTGTAQRAHLRTLRVDGLRVDYVRTPAVAAAEARRLDQALALAEQLAARPIALRVDALDVANGTFGFVSETTEPHFRIALTDADVRLRDFDTTATAPAHLTATGKLQDSGTLRVDLRFPARWQDPAFTFALRLRNADLRKMNDALRAFAGLDVASGRLFVTANLDLRAARLNGELRPAIQQIDVHDPEQDADDNILQQAYEGIVGTIAGLLESDDPDEAPDADFGVRADKVTSWTAAVAAVRDAAREKLRTALRLAFSDPLPPPPPQDRD